MPYSAGRRVDEQLVYHRYWYHSSFKYKYVGTNGDCDYKYFHHNSYLVTRGDYLQYQSTSHARIIINYLSRFDWLPPKIGSQQEKFRLINNILE